VTNSLATRFPVIAAELHPDLNNGVTADQIIAGSGEKFWWACAEGPDHIWHTTASRRTWSGTGCPMCANKQVSVTNSLAALFPVIAAELHPDLNNGVTADQIIAGSSKKFWWVCDEGLDHVWQTTADSRTRLGSGCLMCGNQQLSVTNSLAALFPVIAAELHPDLNNGVTAHQIIAGSNKKFWWACAEGPDHVWQTTASSRTWSGTGCPNCHSFVISSLRSFLESLRPHLPSMTNAELFTLVEQHGFLSTDYGILVRELLAGHRSLNEVLDELSTSFRPRSIETNENLIPDNVRDLPDSVVCVDLAAPDNPAKGLNRPAKASLVLAGIAAVGAVGGDAGAVEFLLASAVSKLWSAAYADAESTDIETSVPQENHYAEEARRHFRVEYEEARDLKIPSGYSFRPTPASEMTLPNLMQRHVAVQVVQRRKVGNWSGAGAGKTLSGVLASRVIGARLTIICCPNSVVGLGDDGLPDGRGWIGTITNAFPDSRIAYKTLEPTWEPGMSPRYLVVNYETLQQKDSGGRLEALLAGKDVDMVIVDEIQQVKRRDESLSQRRRITAQLIDTATAKNPDLAVLGMSATPVVNNLKEGQSLIELITNTPQLHLDTRPTIANAIALHRTLVRLGTRWMPTYDSNMEERPVTIDCTDALEEIVEAARRGGLLGIEQVLTEIRLPAILGALIEGEPAVIYTHYVDGIVDRLVEACTAVGRKVGVFTGEDKAGMAAFLAGDIDTLVGSSALGTGVDGLQGVCSNLAFNALPWTAAEMDQIKGRLLRQGQSATNVRLTIPITQATLPDGTTWSWCQERLARLHWKRSLADAAVDGVIPLGRLESEKALLRRALDGLEAWKQRLDEAA